MPCTKVRGQQPAGLPRALPSAGAARKVPSSTGPWRLQAIWTFASGTRTRRQPTRGSSRLQVELPGSRGATAAAEGGHASRCTVVAPPLHAARHPACPFSLLHTPAAAMRFQLAMASSCCCSCLCLARLQKWLCVFWCIAAGGGWWSGPSPGGLCTTLDVPTRYIQPHS